MPAEDYPVSKPWDEDARQLYLRLRSTSAATECQQIADESLRRVAQTSLPTDTRQVYLLLPGMAQARAANLSKTSQSPA